MKIEAVSALASAIGVISAIVMQIREWRRASLTNRMATVTRYEARFEARDFRGLRRAAASYLLAPDAGGADGRDAVKSIINFFESVGYLFEKGMLTDEDAWQFFASWLVPYYVASEKVRAEEAENDPNVYCSIGRLYLAVLAVEAKKHPSRETTHLIAPEAVKQILEDESQLVVRTAA